MEDQRACFKLRLGKQLVVVHARFPRDLFLPNDSRFVIVRDRRFLDCRSCGAMEIQVSLASRILFARRPNESNKILVPVFLVLRSEEEDAGDNGSDLVEVGVGW